MNVVHKFPLPDVESAVEMPAGAEIVDIREQPGGQICLWAIVNTAAIRHQIRHFVGVFTGAPIPSQAEYVKTAHLSNGLVVHYFEVNR